MLGGSSFPPVGELPYLLTLGGHGFYWLRLSKSQTRGVSDGLPAAERSSGYPASEVHL
jgi:maltose alpha-D-glucosyltransferase / alpha-amylase